MNPQLDGLDNLPGTYIFDLRKSRKALKINRFFWQQRDPAFRQLFLDDPERTFDDAGLSDEERQLVVNHDWLGLVQYGVSFFVLEKYARLLRVSNLAVYASMRGETLDDFLKTRKVPASA
jgi:gallate dioxygenase